MEKCSSEGNQGRQQGQEIAAAAAAFEDKKWRPGSHRGPHRQRGRPSAANMAATKQEALLELIEDGEERLLVENT